LKYTVHVEAGGRRTQVRQSVSLVHLRQPFREGELVEVFCKGVGDGQWVPGVMEASQGAFKWATVYGYRVNFADGGSLQESTHDRVPASRLRRRFPEGMPVKVYRGLVLGWIDSIVDSSCVSETDGERVGEEEKPRLQRSSTSTSAFSIFSASSNISGCSLPKRTTKQVEEDADCEPWYSVPVRPTNRECGFRVSSHLVRSLAGVEDSHEALRASAWRSRDLRVSTSAARLLGSDEFSAHEEVEPLMADGQAVEYFSKTHRIWMLGRLEVLTLPGTLLEPPQVTYSVHLKVGVVGQATRRRVPLSAFRRPLKPGESVEIFSRSGGGQWLPAVVESSPLGLDSIVDHVYTVRLSGNRSRKELRVFHRVPPERLRRRFPMGSQVLLYKGPACGWVPAVVELGHVSSVLESVAGPAANILVNEAPRPAFLATMKRTVSFASMNEAKPPLSLGPQESSPLAKLQSAQSLASSTAGRPPLMQDSTPRAEVQRARSEAASVELSARSSRAPSLDSLRDDVQRSPALHRVPSTLSFNSALSGLSGFSGQSGHDGYWTARSVLGPPLSRQISGESQGTTPDLCPWQMLRVRELTSESGLMVPSFFLRLLKQLEGLAEVNS